MSFCKLPAIPFRSSPQADMSPARIIVVDGDHVQSLRVSRMAESLQLPCDMFATAEEMLDAGACPAGGVIVSEFRLMGINGIDMQQKLGPHNRHIQIMFHTAYAETWLTVMAMQHGAYTVLDKPAGEQKLWDALCMGVKRYRNIVEHQSAADRLRSNIDQLNERQRDVLAMVIEGIPNKLIADRLDISVRTVESSRHAIFEKTDTHSVAELVRLVTLAKVDLDRKKHR